MVNNIKRSCILESWCCIWLKLVLPMAKISIAYQNIQCGAYCWCGNVGLLLIWHMRGPLLIGQIWYPRLTWQDGTTADLARWRVTCHVDAAVMWLHVLCNTKWCCHYMRMLLQKKHMQCFRVLHKALPYVCTATPTLATLVWCCLLPYATPFRPYATT